MYHFVPTMSNLTNVEDAQKLPTLLTFGGEAKKGDTAAREASLLTVRKHRIKQSSSFASSTREQGSIIQASDLDLI